MTSPSGDTAHLQALLESGDAEAHHQLLALASQRLLKLTRRMLRNYPHLRRWEATDDVFQTAVMRLHRSLEEVQPESVAQFFGLAAVQIRRTLIDLVRHHFGPEGQAAKHQSAAADQVSSQADAPVLNRPGQTERPETLEAWARFHEAVDLLPQQERDVFQLLWYSDLPQAEVADALGVSVPTVQRRWYRARHLLNQAMSGQCPPVHED